MSVDMRLYSKKELGIIARLVFIGIFITSAFVIFDYWTDGYYTELYLGAFVFDFYHFFPFILSAVMGLIPGVVSFEIIFIYCYMVYGMQSFTVFGYLFIFCIANFLARSRAFKSVKSTVLVAVVVSFVSTNVWQFILRFMAGNTFDTNPFQEFVYFMRELPQYLIAGGIIYFLLNKTETSFRKYMINYFFYTDRYVEEKKKKPLFSNRYKLSRNVTIALGIDLVLIMVATAIFLFPSDYLNYYFESNRELYVFYAKHVMLLLNAVIPCVIMANHFVQKLTIDEIRNFSEFLEGLTEIDDSQRRDYLKKIDRIKPFTNDEISELYEAMKKMVFEEENYFDQIRKDDYVEDDLKVAQAADTAKTNFLSNMTHEIRTPINAILGMDEMILRECGEPRVLGYAGNIRVAGDKLLILVNNILDFSKLESGKMDIVIGEYNFENTIRQLVNMIAYDVRQKALDLRIYVDPKIPSVLSGDEHKLKQSVYNLLDNAIKYTPNEGIVTFSIDSDYIDDDLITLKFTILDTGMGIKDEDLEKLFMPFERIDEDKNRSIQGTGIGLALTSQLLKLMNSRLEIESFYGKGTKASFEINQKVLLNTPVGDFVDNINIDEIYYEKENYVAPDARILVVDDTDLNLNVMRELLKRSLVKVDTSLSGRDALKLCENNEYDIIFIDYRMPNMGGAETVMKMKKSFPNRATKYVVCTASDEGYVSRYKKEGFDD
ncbi:MAG: response regulator, partial [Eubacterium sp.]|nr:response regulator [Eubacterium sp.]